MQYVNELWRVIQSVSMNNCVYKSDWLYYQLPQNVFIGILHSDWTAIPVAACTKIVPDLPPIREGRATPN